MQSKQPGSMEEARNMVPWAEEGVLDIGIGQSQTENT